MNASTHFVAKKLALIVIFASPNPLAYPFGFVSHCPPLPFRHFSSLFITFLHFSPAHAPAHLVN